MKKLVVAGLMLACAFSATNVGAQEKEGEKEEGFIFTTVKENPITSIKNQNRAGTCWCYSTMAFLESELLRMGKGEYDLSEMFTVYHTYQDRADMAVRTHGDASFSQGGSFYDVIYGMEAFGLVPEEEMRPGVMYSDTLSNHGELSALTDAMVGAMAGGKVKKFQYDEDYNLLWKKAVAAVHEIYLGKAPEKFTYKGKEYTPKSFYESTGNSSNPAGSFHTGVVVARSQICSACHANRSRSRRSSAKGGRKVCKSAAEHHTAGRRSPEAAGIGIGRTQSGNRNCGSKISENHHRRILRAGRPHHHTAKP